MILVCYDIADNRLRLRFSKFLSRFGHRLQYSVFEIDNGPRTLAGILAQIEGEFGKAFGETDSVLVLNLSKACKVVRYGYAKHDSEGLLIV